MACEAPIRAYKAANGRLVFFKRTDWQYHQEPYTGLAIPCGTCILCRSEQARQYAVRIAHEAQLHEENSFLTLTYNDKHLPEHGSLNYEHLVKFWKRLRKAYGQMRYYAVGEYGDESLRPHYHAVVFGHAFTHDRIIVQQKPHVLWISPQLNEIWGHGDVKIGALTFETARYTASYVTKKLRSKQQYVRIDEQTGELVRVTQPRAFMSRNIARQWWEEYGKFAAEHDFVVINGKRQKPPKAYDRWLNEVDEKKMAEIKENRRKKAKYVSTEKTRARARNAHAHAKKKSKKV